MKDGQVELLAITGPGQRSLGSLYLSVKASRKVNRNRFGLSGLFDATEEEFVAAEAVHFLVGPYIQAISTDLFKASNSPGVYVFSGSVGGLSKAKFNFAKGWFVIAANKLDLTGLAAPVRVEIIFGDYFGVGEVREETINGKKPLGEEATSLTVGVR